MARAGDVVDGKYELLQVAGTGGMSRVWLARDRKLNKLWAVKEMDPRGRGGVEERSLLAEASLLKGLDHPALPRVVDIVDGADGLFVVMDFVEGVSLKCMRERAGGALPQKDVIEWGIQLCDVLGYLHGLTPPVVYRDMKPGNVMLREDGTVKLVDFGTARRFKVGAAGDTTVLGTRGYAAPEQLAGDLQTDARSDVYSLGVTLHALVTGLSPSSQAYPRPIREVDPSLDEGLEIVLERATRANPDERYQTCEQMGRDLRDHRKLTAGYRAGLVRRVRRFGLALGGALSAALFGAACLAASTHLRAATFDSLVQRAEAAGLEAQGGGESPAEAAWRDAVAADPRRIAAYEGLVAALKADGELTPGEASRLVETLEAHRADIAGDGAYARLCYDVGLLIFVYYSPDQAAGADTGLDAGRLSARWFRAALAADGGEEGPLERSTSSLTPSERACAEAYATMGEFCGNLVQAVPEGAESDVYEGYWEALGAALDGMGEDDPPIARLRLDALARNLIASPVHLSGLRRTGVGEREARALLARATSDAESLGAEAVANERLGELYREVVGDGAASEAGRNIEVVYGAVGNGADQAADAEGGDAA